MSKSAEQFLTIYVRNTFITLGNPLLAHQEVVSDVVSETRTKKIRSLTAFKISATDNVSLSEKLTTTQQ